MKKTIIKYLYNLRFDIEIMSDTGIEHNKETIKKIIKKCSDIYDKKRDKMKLKLYQYAGEEMNNQNRELQLKLREATLNSGEIQYPNVYFYKKQNELFGYIYLVYTYLSCFIVEYKHFKDEDIKELLQIGLDLKKII